MKTLLILSLLLNAGIGLSQSDSEEVNRFAVKFSPLSLMVPYTGSAARLAIEYRVCNYWTLEHEAGFSFRGSTGTILRTELRRYIKGLVGSYISLDLFYKNQQYSTNEGIPEGSDDFVVTKHVGAISIKGGLIYTANFGMIFDWYAECGVRYQENKNTLSWIENQYMQSTSDYGPNIILNKARNRWYPNLSAGLKVGFAVRGKKEKAIRRNPPINW